MSDHKLKINLVKSKVKSEKGGFKGASLHRPSLEKLFQTDSSTARVMTVTVLSDVRSTTGKTY